ncbi:hypothetical protein [Streptomonospora salina]|uniref:Uncharacterized protein n=1 Tax=Streptomonospora salina TaxID=104205 RepID=A0A841ECI5_9ACTN|nr:hypothetical protein [Streptomonospora salina]MBB5998773.1 hypothetical protein [Streptomonospora salina]
MYYDLIPSMGFEPKFEDIHRFALQLTRTRPAGSGLRPRRSASVRVRIGTDEAGVLAYGISGPRRAGSILRHPTYGRVEIRELSDERVAE